MHPFIVLMPVFYFPDPRIYYDRWLSRFINKGTQTCNWLLGCTCQSQLGGQWRAKFHRLKHLFLPVPMRSGHTEKPAKQFVKKMTSRQSEGCCTGCWTVKPPVCSEFTTQTQWICGRNKQKKQKRANTVEVDFSPNIDSRLPVPQCGRHE